MNFLITCDPEDQERAAREIRAAGHEPFFKGVLADEIEAEHVKIHGGIDSAGDKSYDWFGHTKRLEMMITGMAKIFPDGGYL